MGVKSEWPTMEAVTASIVVVVADRSHHGYVSSSTSRNKVFCHLPTGVLVFCLFWTSTKRPQHLLKPVVFIFSWKHAWWWNILRRRNTLYLNHLLSRLVVTVQKLCLEGMLSLNAIWVVIFLCSSLPLRSGEKVISSHYNHLAMYCLLGFRPKNYELIFPLEFKSRRDLD